MLLHSIPNHDWIGRLLFGIHPTMRKEMYLGVIREVADIPDSPNYFVKVTFNEGENDYFLVPKVSIYENGVVRF
jgi:hypothetical protein